MKSKDRKRFSHRIDMWDDDGENVLEHLAGVEDFDLAMATYRAACLRWPGAAITIRQGARILEDPGSLIKEIGPIYKAPVARSDER